MARAWAVGLAMVLAGCVTNEGFEGTEDHRGPESVIATGQDQGADRGVLANGRAAIVYDPDGCQNWLIDDGLEGYASPRFDPRTGRPVCDGRYPPGTVLRPYQSGSQGIEDRISGPGIRTEVLRR